MKERVVVQCITVYVNAGCVIAVFPACNGNSI